MENKRRDFFKMGLSSMGALLLSSKGVSALASSCGFTPAQTAGPFYPGEKKFSVENDLTIVNGRKAKGEVVVIKGVVQDESCRPIAGANVEIWQACASGRYNNAKDTNPAALDANFKYWAETFTNTQGEYSFKTIVPGAYPADVGWTRPPHIHFKVSCLGFHDLITQMYFAGEALNAKDEILKQIPVAERESVIVEFLDKGMRVKEGMFLITLKSVR